MIKVAWAAQRLVLRGLCALWHSSAVFSVVTNSVINFFSLIGMPASGKSTLGRLLAARLELAFIDGDALIEDAQGLALPELLAQRGYLGLRAAEEDALLAANFDQAVLATGGSAVYSAAVMKKLHEGGPVVFIDLPLEQLASRLGVFEARGIACAPGTDLPALYAERQPLYEREADLRVSAAGRSKEELVDEIAELVGHWSRPSK